MRLYRSSEFEIRHPEHPEVYVRGILPTEIERLDLTRKLSHREAFTVKDSETRQPIFDATTRQQMVHVSVETAPATKIAAALKPFIKEIGGLDVDGGPPEIINLANPKLSFYRDEPIDDPINGEPYTDDFGRRRKVVMRDGKPVMAPVLNFFLNEVLNEILLPSRNGDDDAAKKESSPSSTDS